MTFCSQSLQQGVWENHCLMVDFVWICSRMLGTMRGNAASRDHS